MIDRSIMQKQVVLRDDVVAKLDSIRDTYKCSYNTAIDRLLKKEPHDLRLLEINDLFGRLGITVPEDMSTMVEVFRVIIVRTYLLGPNERSENKNTTGSILEQLLDDVLGDDNK